MPLRKPILCLDFDGVIHSYTSGWQGAAVIPDPPVPGAFEFMYAATSVFEIAIFSSRSNQLGGQFAMRIFVERYAKRSPDAHLMTPGWWNSIDYPTCKPAAFITIDDRAITFTGQWPDIDELRVFKPWNKRGV